MTLLQDTLRECFTPLTRGCRPRTLQGFTLIELMVVVAISGIVFASLYQLCIDQSTSYSLQNDIAEMQQNARASEYMMVRELRMAGYKIPDLDITADVPGESFSNGEREPFEETNPQAITFTSDVDGDGTMETVRYALNKYVLTREMWRWSSSEGRWQGSGGARALSENIDMLNLSYWILADDAGLNNDQDDDGDSLVDEEGELIFSTQPDKEEREHITMVKLILTARVVRPDPDYTHPLYGDHFRRVTFSSTIKVRNMGL